MSDGWRSSRATATRIRLPDDAVMALVRLGRTSAVVSVEVVDRGLLGAAAPPARDDRSSARRASRRSASPGSVDVPLIDLVGCDPEQLGHLLDDDGVHQCLELVATLGAVLDRTAEEHQSGGLLALAPAPARRAARCRRPSRRAPSGASSTAYSTRPRCRCQRSSRGCHDIEHELVEALATRAQGRGSRGSGGTNRRGRASPDRGGRAYAATGSVWRCRRRGRACREPKRRVDVCGVARRRESCPSVFAFGLWSLGDQHADLCLRRPDRGPRSAGHVRRAPRLRPLRAPQRACRRPAGLGGPAPRPRTRTPRSPAATTCWRWPTRSVRPAARRPHRSRCTPPTIRRAGRSGGTCGCSHRPTDPPVISPRMPA